MEQYKSFMVYALQAISKKRPPTKAVTSPPLKSVSSTRTFHCRFYFIPHIFLTIQLSSPISTPLSPTSPILHSNENAPATPTTLPPTSEDSPTLIAEKMEEVKIEKTESDLNSLPDENIRYVYLLFAILMLTFICSKPLKKESDAGANNIDNSNDINKNDSSDNITINDQNDTDYTTNKLQSISAESKSPGTTPRRQ